MDEIIARIERAELTATEYRAARRLLDRIERNRGYVRMDHDQACELCGVTSWPAARKVLKGLHDRHQLFHVATNGAVFVTLEDEESDPNRRESRQNDANRADSDRFSHEDGDPNRRESRQNDANRADSTRIASNRIDGEGGDYIPAFMVRLGEGDPAPNLTIGGGGGNAPKPPLTPDQARAFDMLFDIGLNAAAAETLAREYELDEVQRQCCTYLRDLAAEEVTSPGVLVGPRGRFERGAAAWVTPADRVSDFWQRHMGDTPDEKLGAWLAAQHAWQDAHAGDAPEPEPEPGTPAAWWRQVQAEMSAGDGRVTWIGKTHVLDFDEDAGALLVAVPEMWLDWARSKLAGLARRKLTVMAGRTISVEFVAGEGTCDGEHDG